MRSRKRRFTIVNGLEKLASSGTAYIDCFVGSSADIVVDLLSESNFVCSSNDELSPHSIIPDHPGRQLRHTRQGFFVDYDDCCDLYPTTLETAFYELMGYQAQTMLRIFLARGKEEAYALCVHRLLSEYNLDFIFTSQSHDRVYEHKKGVDANLRIVMGYVPATDSITSETTMFRSK